MGVARLALGDRVIEIRVRASARARRARLVVGPTGPPEVVVPAGAPPDTAERLLAARAGWLERHLRRRDEVAARRALVPRLGLDRPGTIWLDGAPVPLRHVAGGARARATLGEGAGEAVVTGPPAGAAEALERLLRHEARSRLTEAATREAHRLGVTFARLGVRDPRTRWGSCSSDGGLSLSWRLVMAPVAVRECVVVHELCHLRLLDHSPAFWALLERARPAWRAESRWLDDHGEELLAYRRPGALAAVAAPDLPSAELGQRP